MHKTLAGCTVRIMIAEVIATIERCYKSRDVVSNALSFLPAPVTMRFANHGKSKKMLPKLPPRSEGILQIETSLRSGEHVNLTGCELLHPSDNAMPIDLWCWKGGSRHVHALHIPH